MSRSRKKRPSSAWKDAALKPAPGALTRQNPWPWLLLAACSGAAYLLVYFNAEVLWYLGVQHYDAWFADALAVLASNDAVTLGLDPYAPNPLDIFNRPHVYSHWWLQLRMLGLTRADIVWLGPTLVTLFWLAALRWLRPRSRPQFFYYLALLSSPPVLLALDRANNDLVIFLVLTPVVSCLLHRRAAIRYLAVGLVGFAAGLKYFPAAAGLVLLADAPLRELRTRLALAVVALALVAASVAPDLAIFGPLAPKASGWMSFGAANAFSSWGWTGSTPTWAALVGGAALLAWGWFSPWLKDATPALEQASPGQKGDALRFVMGAAVLTGCFFASSNFGYRWVFALWLAPHAWTLAHDSAVPAAARRLALLTQWLLVVVLWLGAPLAWVAIIIRGRVEPDGIRAWVKWSAVAEQPVLWLFFGCLLFYLARFVRERGTTLFARAK